VVSRKGEGSEVIARGFPGQEEEEMSGERAWSVER
jgi:hypothetical protein